MGDDAGPEFLGIRLVASHADRERVRSDTGDAVRDALRLASIGTGERLPAKEARRLTKREVECLAWAAQGKSEWEISQILGISEHTAEKHLINARVKLGAVNRVHAVATALRRGVIR